MTTQERKVMELALEALELMYGCYANPSWVSYKVHEDQILEQTLDTVTAFKEALAQPEQELVAWQEIECPCCGDLARASPPQRKPLTWEQKLKLVSKYQEDELNEYELIEMVEAAHGIKE